MKNQDWSYGYVTEVGYTTGFYVELCPSRLWMASLMNGFHFPSIEKPFNYLELACGYGMSISTLAACYPQSHFFATDFNPSHIAMAKKLAEEANLTNITFFEDSFEELKNRSLPMFDFICFHGTYSWVSAENRNHMLDIIKNQLNTGGIVYVSYNSLPGWAPASPLRRLMYELEINESGPILSRLERALQFMDTFKESDALFFTGYPQLKQRIEKLKEHNRNYLAHEYLNDAWDLFYHADVVADMKSVKCSYLGSANLIDNVDQYCFPPKALAQAKDITNTTLKETLKDFAMNQQFRRDIFVRGVQRMTVPERINTYSQTRFALIRPRNKCDLTVKVPIGDINLKPEIYNPILDSFQQGPKSCSDLMKLADISKIGMPTLIDAINLLASFSYIHPCSVLSDHAATLKSAHKFNQTVIQRALNGNALNTIALPMIGSGMQLNIVEQLLLLSYIEKQQNSVATTWNRMKSLGHRFIHEGQPVQDEQENIKRLEELAKSFQTDMLPIVRHLGIKC
ncbi:MAG: class I SAM-dependent methyltransferase [Desulfobacterales bacterium]|nr:class I SAM-dependent methyltransferase [Desulfobacterales bacterium]